MAAKKPSDDADTTPEPPFGIRRVLKPVTTLHLMARPLGVAIEDRKKGQQANFRIETVLMDKPAGPRPKGDEEPEPAPNFSKRLVVMQPKRGDGGPVQGIGSMQADFKAR